MKSFAQNHHFYILFISLLMMSSCVKEMDFDGAKDITLEPTMEIKLATAEITTQQVISIMDEEVAELALPPELADTLYKAELPVPADTASVDITSEERIVKYLEGAELNFNFINTTPRDITIKVVLLMDDDSVIRELEKEIPFSTEEPIVSLMKFEGKKEVEQLKKLTKVSIQITVESGVDLRSNSEGKFELTSNGIFNFKYDVSDGLP